MIMSLFTVAVLALGANDTPAATNAEAEAVKTWREARLARLQSPDGWLTLIGLHWIDLGKHTIGAAADNDIVIEKLAPHFGTLTVSEGKIHLELAEGVDATIDGAATRAADLAADATGKPTVVAQGTVNFIVIERSGRFALRVKDSQAATRTGFLGLDFYDVDESLRIDARFEKHEPGKTIPIATVINTLEPMANPGAVVFEKDGKTFRLEAVDEGDGQLFIIFADRTNGKETYGAGRFVYAQPPAPGSDRVVLDFNLAYNPPCVFTPYATCPLPPPENRLDLAVRAGEKKYRGAHH